MVSIHENKVLAALYTLTIVSIKLWYVISNIHIRHMEVWIMSYNQERELWMLDKDEISFPGELAGEKLC